MATNGMPEKQQQKTAPLLKASDEQTLQCGHYNAQLQHLIKKKGKDLLLQLVLTLPLFSPSPPFPLFFFFFKGNLVPEKDLKVPATGRELTRSILHDTSNSRALAQAAKGTN